MYKKTKEQNLIKKVSKYLRVGSPPPADQELTSAVEIYTCLSDFVSEMY
jgi:hypothetical protein